MSSATLLCFQGVGICYSKSCNKIILVVILASSVCSATRLSIAVSLLEYFSGSTKEVRLYLEHLAPITNYLLAMVLFYGEEPEPHLKIVPHIENKCSLIGSNLTSKHNLALCISEPRTA